MILLGLSAEALPKPQRGGPPRTGLFAAAQPFGCGRCVLPHRPLCGRTRLPPPPGGLLQGSIANKGIVNPYFTAMEVSLKILKAQYVWKQTNVLCFGIEVLWY